MSPRATVGDGNCAYRAVSLALFETQDLHPYVRLLTACEVAEHPQQCDVSSPDCVMTDNRIVTSPYRDILQAVLTPNKDVELIHFFAISAAFDVRTLRDRFK